MGQSTDAILCYGIPLKDGSVSIDTKELDDRWSKDMVISTVPEMIHFCRELEGLEVVMHCSYEYQMYIVAIKDAQYLASRGYPKLMHPESLRPLDTWEQKLKDFVAKHELDTDGEPGWYLCSMVG